MHSFDKMKLLFRLVSLFCLIFNVAGYIVYCPCMGRFGNQVDQFLGTLGFAKKVNRTLVLPPFIEYLESFENGHGLRFWSFNELFNITELEKYHSVITMEKFMEDVAPHVWPPGERKAFCYSRSGQKLVCPVKEGRPFKHFWDHFRVNFDQDVSLDDIHYSSDRFMWDSQFPPEKYPVLAFPGAPGSFPIDQESVPRHRYLMWNASFDAQIEEMIATYLPRPYVAIHLRNDRDFDRVCEMLDDSGLRVLFDSAQCLGYSGNVPIKKEMCAPPDRLVMAHTRQMMAEVGASTLLVATDRLDLEETFRNEFGSSLRVFRSTGTLDTHFRHDLALLGRADGAVLNCVSSFSAFAKRERDVRGLKTEYFGHTPLRKVEL